MTHDSTHNKSLVADYLRTLSGAAKTPELVGRYVSDEALLAHIAQVEAAFPRYEFVADDMVAEGDRVAVRATFKGVHQGAFFGMPATGREVRTPVLIIYRIDDGRIREHWMQMDTAAVAAQLQA